jgi:hypothetical protein
MDSTKPRRYWQFGLRTLLWLILCIAIGFGGYRQGFEQGTEAYLNHRQEVGRTFNAVYYVSDVLPKKTTTSGGVVVDFNWLIDDMKTNVLPQTWDSSGGEASIAEFATNLSLVVSHDKDGHERVAKYLDDLRRKNGSYDPIASKKTGQYLQQQEKGSRQPLASQ